MRYLALIFILLPNMLLAATITDDTAKSAIVQAYLKYWNLEVPHPYYVRGSMSGYAGYERGGSYNLSMSDGWTATVWDQKTGYIRTVYLEPDGTTHQNNSRIHVPPKGTVRCAIFIDDNGKTDFPQRMSDWRNQVEAVNNSWFAFAAAQGMSTAIAKLETVEFIGSPGELPGTFSGKSGVESYLKSQGYSAQDFDVLIWISLDPQNTDGAYAGAYQISVNHFYGGSPNFYSYSQREMAGIAATTFSHELGHIFGWDHGDTQTSFDDDYIIIDPGYYGWRDMDGDGVVAILDETPYGIGANLPPIEQPPIDEPPIDEPQPEPLAPTAIIGNLGSSSFSTPYWLELTGMASTPNSSQNSALSYRWTINNQVVGETRNITQVLENAGDYKIQLTVTNSDGLSDSATLSITLQTPPTVNTPPIDTPPDNTDDCPEEGCINVGSFSYPFILLGVALLIGLRLYRILNARDFRP